MTKDELQQALENRTGKIALGLVVLGLTLQAGCGPVGARTAVPETTATPQPTPTEVPIPSSPTAPAPEVLPETGGEKATGELLREQMTAARQAGQETFNFTDPTGIAVEMDVVPPEVAQNQFDWNLRGFTQETDRGLEVWRTGWGPEGVDASRWLVVVDQVDLTHEGLGVYTIETADPERLADPGVLQTPVSNPRFNRDNIVNFIAGLNYLWNSDTSWRHIQVKDYQALKEATQPGPKSGNNQQLPETSSETIHKSAGGSIILTDAIDASYAVSFANIKTGVPHEGWKTDSQNGRWVLTFYPAAMFGGPASGESWSVEKSNRVTGLFLGTRISAYMQWISRGADLEDVKRMLIDQNPLVTVGSGGTPMMESGLRESYKAFHGGELPTDVDNSEDLSRRLFDTGQQ